MQPAMLEMEAAIDSLHAANLLKRHLQAERGVTCGWVASGGTKETFGETMLLARASADAALDACLECQPEGRGTREHLRDALTSNRAAADRAVSESAAKDGALLEAAHAAALATAFYSTLLSYNAVLNQLVEMEQNNIAGVGPRHQFHGAVGIFSRLQVGFFSVCCHTHFCVAPVCPVRQPPTSRVCRGTHTPSRSQEASAIERGFLCGALSLPDAALAALPSRAFAGFVLVMQQQRQLQVARQLPPYYT